MLDEQICSLQKLIQKINLTYEEFWQFVGLRWAPHMGQAVGRLRARGTTKQ